MAGDKVKKAAKDYYNSKEDAFEGVREVGRAVGGAMRSAGKAVMDKMPHFSPASPAAKRVIRVEGPFPTMDVTPHTMMNNPKKYKKG